MVSTVLIQVVILFILITVGFTLAKLNVIEDKAARGITDICLYIVTPCVIIKSFIRPYDSSTVKYLLIALLISVLAHIFFIVLSRFTLFDKDDSTERVLRFGSVFSNCGFMSIPLLEAVLGADGVFYGSAFLAVFNLFVWSYGITLMSGDRKFLSAKKLIINPGLIGIVLGLAVFLLQLKLPGVILQPVSYLAALNTPLPMIIIGYHLAHSNMLNALKSVKCIYAILLRVLIMPAAVVTSMYLFGVPDIILKSIMISACAPTAAITTMFSAKFSKNTELSVGMVSLSTLVSIATMPLITYFTEFLVSL